MFPICTSTCPQCPLTSDTHCICTAHHLCDQHSPVAPLRSQCSPTECRLGAYGTMQCSDCTEKCRDSSSEESQEINVDVAPPRRQPTTRKPQDMDKYYTKKVSGGSKGCPGSLAACMAACPSNVQAFMACAATCSRRCSKK